MTVRVSFHLRRRNTVAPALALFVPGRDAAALLSVCTRLGLDPSGRVHDVAGGFVLKLERPTTELVPGATRLRELAADLLVPVDAELIPSLLDDEVGALVRDGGLVFLPGGSVLRFDREATVSLEALLSAPARPRRDWRPMSEPRRLADRIVEIARQWPDVPPDELYREWEQDIRRPGSERRESRDREGPGQGPGADSPGATSPGGAEAGPAGGVMPGGHGVGDALRKLVGRAGSGAKALGEKFQWGIADHSALVQKLLREFRQGDPGRALRHALPMTPADPRDRMAGMGNRLPWTRAVYNLFDLLGRPPRGQPVGIWQARQDLMEELTREYRKAAEQAIQQGDFRRAAYIYGKLLGDDRTAAQSLQRGGLHHDAAILFLQKVNDRAAAAQAFEAAGQVDRAIELYRQLGQHEAAGDLLRRIGDDAGAVAAYLDAVDRAMDEPRDWFEVGRIMSYKVGLVEAAIDAFERGWDTRPAANATACALELAVIHAGRGRIEPLRDLLDEADAFFRSVGSARDAEAFYNRIAVIAAAAPAFAASADEVRDRALVGLAHHLRRQVEAGCPATTSVSALFGEPSLWPSSFVRDAHFAAAAAERSRLGTRDPIRLARPAPPAPEVQVGRGMVTAACHASATRELFLGFADGKVLAYQPGRNLVVTVVTFPGPVAAITADPDGQIVVALCRTEHGAILTGCLRRPDGSIWARPDAHFPGQLWSWLTPILSVGTDHLVGVGDGRELLILDAIAGLPRARVPLTAADEPPATALLLPSSETYRVLTHDGSRWLLIDQDGCRIDRSDPAWRPAGGRRRARCSVPLTWVLLEGVAKVIGLDEHGAVYASQFWIEDRSLELLSCLVATTDGGYLAATQSGHGKVVAVSSSRIDWLGYRTDRLQPVRTLQETGLGATVACFPSTGPDEVLVVSSEGLVARFASRRRSRD